MPSVRRATPPSPSFARKPPLAEPRDDSCEDVISLRLCMLPSELRRDVDDLSGATSAGIKGSLGAILLAARCCLNAYRDRIRIVGTIVGPVVGVDSRRMRTEGGEQANQAGAVRNLPSHFDRVVGRAGSTCRCVRSRPDEVYCC